MGFNLIFQKRHVFIFISYVVVFLYRSISFAFHCFGLSLFLHNLNPKVETFKTSESRLIVEVHIWCRAYVFGYEQFKHTYSTSFKYRPCNCLFIENTWNCSVMLTLFNKSSMNCEWLQVWPNWNWLVIIWFEFDQWSLLIRSFCILLFLHENLYSWKNF